MTLNIHGPVTFEWNESEGTEGYVRLKLFVPAPSPAHIRKSGGDVYCHLLRNLPWPDGALPVTTDPQPLLGVEPWFDGGSELQFDVPARHALGTKYVRLLENDALLRGVWVNDPNLRDQLTEGPPERE